MGLAKYRSDFADQPQKDGAVVCHSRWMGGTPISRVDNCRLANMAGDMRATVYVQGEPDTYFSIPAKCYLRGVVVNGYLTSDDDDIVFRHTYY
jgi:hypothetical protein